MLRKDMVSEKIIEILGRIRPGQQIFPEESLFGFKNTFNSRDVAYLLLELEEIYSISVQKLIDAAESGTGEYSVNEIVELVSTMEESARK